MHLERYTQTGRPSPRNYQPLIKLAASAASPKQLYDFLVPDLVGCMQSAWLASPVHRVRESVNKSAASAASLDYAKFQAVIKLAASAASLRGGRASGRLDHGLENPPGRLR